MDSFPALSPSGGDGPRQSDGAEDSNAQRRVSRKLQKKRHDDPSAATLDLPEPLKQSDSDDEESPNDPASQRGRAMSVNMNQSIFGLIAAAGSRVDFNTRFDDGSSDEDDSENSKASAGSQDLSQTIILPPQDKDTRRGHKKKLSSGHRLLKSLSTLPKRKSKKRETSRLSAPVMESSDDARDSAEFPTPAIALEKDDNRLAPVMSRMLQARAEVASRPSFDLERRSSDLGATDDSDESSALAKRLMEIFEFDEPEQVIEGKLQLQLLYCICVTLGNLLTFRLQNTLVGYYKVCSFRVSSTSRPSIFAFTPISPRKLCVVLSSHAISILDIP